MRSTIALFVLIVACCGPIPPPKPPDPPLPPPVENVDCGAVCERAATLSCEWAESTPDGATCVQVCQKIQDSGVVQWDLECRVQSESCAEMDACER